MKNSIAIQAAWSDFAAELIAEECPKFASKVDPAHFGLLMSKLIARDGFVDSVLWNSVVPSGTEDRTWVRAYLHQSDIAPYAGILDGLDGAHAKHCASHLSDVWESAA